VRAQACIQDLSLPCHDTWKRFDVRGVGVMGTFDQTVNGEGSPGAPCVRIRGFSLWGSVAVKRKKRKAL